MFDPGREVIRVVVGGTLLFCMIRQALHQPRTVIVVNTFIQLSLHRCNGHDRIKVQVLCVCDTMFVRRCEPKVLKILLQLVDDRRKTAQPQAQPPIVVRVRSK